MSQLSEAFRQFSALVVAPPAVVAGLWSNPATWGGSLPVAGDAITIPFGTAITLDTTTAKLGSLTVSGDLIVSATVDSWLQTNQMVVTSTGRYMSGGWSTATIPMPLTPNPRKHRRTMTGPQKAGTVKGLTHDPITDISTGNNGGTNDDGGIRRGLLVMDGGKYLINAARPAVLKTCITNHCMAGATVLPLDHALNWKAGDEIIIYGTDFPGGTGTQSRCERRILAADTNGAASLTVTVPLAYDHWGKLQYPQDNGSISLSPGQFSNDIAQSFTGSISGLTLTITAASSSTIKVGQRVKAAGVMTWTFVTALGTGTGGVGTYSVSKSQTVSSTALKLIGMKPTDTTPSVLNQRAKVMLLTRSHVVDGDADLSNSTDRFSAHEMYMGISHITKVIGMQYAQCGQGGLLGRYPIHDHMNAYNPNGTTKTNPLTGLSDGMYAVNQRLHQDCSVTDSFNRMQSAHGVKGGLFKNLVGDNIKGHGYFLEDGSETQNTWDSCHVSRTVDPGAAWRLKIHDGPGNQALDGVDSRASGWWITNNDNFFTNTSGYKNGGVECEGNGCMVVASKDRAGFPGGCFGASSQVPLHPAYTPLAGWGGFECHGNLFRGMDGQYGVLSEAGRLQFGRDPLNITKAYLANNYDSLVGLQFFDDELWKNSNGAYANQVFHIDYQRRIFADNKTEFIFGNVNDGFFDSCLWVRQSLNNWSGDPGACTAMVSYHGSGIARNSAMLGFDIRVQPVPSSNPDRFLNRLTTPAPIGVRDTYLFPHIGYSATMVNMRFPEGLNQYIPPQPSLQVVAPFATFSGGAIAQVYGGGSNSQYDPEGVFFGNGFDKFGVPDHPLITYGASGIQNVPNSIGQYMGLVTTTTNMYGLARENLTPLYTDGTNAKGQPVAWQRVDPATGADVAGAGLVWQASSDIAAHVSGQDFMCSLPEGGWIRMYNNVDPTKKWKLLDFYLRSSVGRSPGVIGIGIPWANTDAFKYGYFGGSSSDDLLLVSVANWAALQAAPAEAFWRDTTNQIVWVKMKQYPFTRGTQTNAIGTEIHGDQPGTWLTEIHFHV